MRGHDNHALKRRWQLRHDVADGGEPFGGSPNDHEQIRKLLGLLHDGPCRLPCGIDPGLQRGFSRGKPHSTARREETICANPFALAWPE